MTERERYVAALRFERPWPVPFSPGCGRESTLAAWHKQGLPADVTDYHAHVCDLLDIPHEAVPAPEGNGPGVDFRMMPRFEEKVIERRERTLVVQDWKGNICEISDEYDVTYLRDPKDFVTRRWIKCPVASRQDWEQMKSRYRSDNPARFAADSAAQCDQLRDRKTVSGIVIPGPFWQLREWLGFEGLCIRLLDDAEFVRDMIRFWEAFVADLLDRMLRHYVSDYILVEEDMAYKEKSMIGPQMCRELLLPCWRLWYGLCKGAGAPIYEVDSDGHVGELIPVWIAAGFNCNSPQEVAAGNDLPAYHARFGTQMAYRGGVDKRAMAKGGRALHDEIERLRPVVQSGGYIPECDHGIPADVSWANFVEYCHLLAEATGWL